MAYGWQNSQKSSTRIEILESAAKTLRKKGIRGTSVAEVMKAAGLTVGGFYAHFRSKDQMILETFRALMKATGERLHALPKAERFNRFLRYYLSAEHRDHPEQGCPILPIIYEASLASKEFREEFTHDLEGTLRARLKEFDLGENEEAFEKLLASYSTLMGAQLLARATRGTAFSDKILQSALRSIENESKAI